MADDGTPFSFGFKLHGDSDQPSSSEPHHHQDEQEKEEEQPHQSEVHACDLYNAPAQELFMSSLCDEASHHAAAESVEIIPGGFSMLKGRVTGQEASMLLHDNRVADNDLIPGVYEGGFKLWEGSIDLSRHLLSKFAPLINGESSPLPLPLALEGKKVLELGCGHGLPGILCLMMGAEVHFQDYNQEVLTQLTMPNILANFSRLLPSAAGRGRPRTRFFSGDWGNVGHMLSVMGMGGEYDFILTSESIYNEESSVRLLETIKRTLRPPHGVAIVASKSYYFGVGGGTKAFRKLLMRDGIFEVVSGGSRTIEGQADSGNKREVIEVKFPDSIAPYFL